MKAILEFTLPEDEQDFEDATDGREWHGVVEDVFDHIRRKLKYGIDVPQMVVVELEELRQMMQDELD